MILNRLKGLPVIAAAIAALAPAAARAQEAAAEAATAVEPVSNLNSGDTAWMLTASLLVLMMSVPGLALFYGGLVKKDNVLATLMQTLAVVAIVSVLWPVIGYSLAFTEGNGFVGGLEKALLAGILPGTESGTIPETVFIMFQMTFAAITTALLLGSIADRIRFSAVLLFAPLWMIVVYAPVAHWVWGPGGFIGGIGVEGFTGIGGFGAALDYAGGTVVHINSGIAGLVAALVLGRSIDFGNKQSTSNNLVMSVIGTGLLWVGWFGFNAGSALTSGANAGMAMLVTNTAAAMACIVWILVELAHKGKASVAGACSGVVAGLVAITPASGFVGFGASLVIGAAAGVLCYGACTYLKARLKYDDSLDVFGIHGMGGIVGALLTGVFASPEINAAGIGLLAGNPGQVMAQLISIIVTMAYSGIATLVLLKAVNMVVKLRVAPEVEKDGLDVALHGESLPWATAPGK